MPATSLAPNGVVTAPTRVPTPYGLDSVLQWRAGDRFETGITFSSDPCGPINGRGGAMCWPAGESDPNLPKKFDSPGLGEASAFVVYGSYECNPIGTGIDEAQGFADRRLAAGEVARVEQALWTGDLGNMPNFSGANGFAAPVDLGSSANAVAALAAVEQGIAEHYGAQGVIHMSRALAILVSRHLDKRGGRLYTFLDTPVVAGAGYPDDNVIIGTPALFGYRGAAFTSSNIVGDLLDRAQNVMRAVAEREYLVGIDACPLVSATYAPTP